MISQPRLGIFHNPSLAIRIPSARRDLSDPLETLKLDDEVECKSHL